MISRLTSSWVAPARWAVSIFVGLGVLVGIAYLAFKVAPDLFADTKGLDAKGRADARQGVRTASLALVAGTIAVVGSIYTARTFGLNRAGQITDRFTKAVDQLGDDKKTIRLGGIYALERIARDSKNDHPQVMEVLTAFVREGAPWPPNSQPPEALMHPSPVILPTEVDSFRSSRATAEETHSPDTDVQAALTVVGRRKLVHEPEPVVVRRWSQRGTGSWSRVTIRSHSPRRLNLSLTDLRRANLKRANLEKADLSRASLEQANLEGANLEGADLEGVDLAGANLDLASLAGANLAGANLEGAHVVTANLAGANLAGANLAGADLAGANLARANLVAANLAGADLSKGLFFGWAANLERANLAGANLAGANLAEANLAGADLSRARYNAATQWPDGFDPNAYRPAYRPVLQE